MDNPGYVADNNHVAPFTISRPNSDTKRPNPAELLVDVKSRFKPLKKSTYYKRINIILTIVVLVLITFLIILLIFYINASKLTVCTSDQCIRSAANLKYSMDFSVDPCDDFYRFCCGRWSKEHPNHGWYSSFSTFTTITEKIVLEAMDALSEPVKDGEPVSVGQAKTFYKSCLATDSIDALGLSPLYDSLALIDLPVVPRIFLNESLGSFDWKKAEVRVKRVLAMDLFIGCTVQPNIYKRDENALYLGVLFQSSPLPSPLRKNFRNSRRPWKLALLHSTNSTDVDKGEEAENDALRTKIRTNIIKHVVKEVMRNNSQAVPTEERLQSAADIINNITNHLDQLNDNFTLPSEGNVTGEDETRQMSLKQLQEFTDNNVQAPMPDFWIEYMQSLFEETTIIIDPDKDRLLVTETELGYLWTVLDYVSSQPPEHIELYMWWAAVYAMIINTSSNVTDYILRQTQLYYSSTSDTTAVYVRSRSLDCCELVSKYMGWAVSYGVADRMFANRTKPKVEKMISDIKEAFIEHVQSITWMDTATKKMTLEKSKEMLSFVGYPDWLFEEGALDKQYIGLEIDEDTYLANMISIIMQYTNETLTSLRRPNKRSWSTEAITVNAFNSFSDNAINVPMAILNFPIYDLGLEVLNYGSMGSIVGHELTHGFDNAGRKHDKFGNYVQWWSDSTIETFNNLTKCFIDQYSNYTIEGVKGHVKGAATLGENLADNGGLNQAFTAYRKYRSRQKMEQKLPGFETFSSDQMFFVAYGSLWCETISMEDLENQLEYDEHCPNAIRVMGVLQNSDDFSRAFNCPKNSPMNPARKRCKLW